MARFDIEFNSKIPVISEPNFGQFLATRLLDILVGHGGSCTPDPVPFDEHAGHYIIGHSNNFWLYPKGEGKYTVVSRYMDQETLNAAKMILCYEWRHQLKPVEPDLR